MSSLTVVQVALTDFEIVDADDGDILSTSVEAGRQLCGLLQNVSACARIAVLVRDVSQDSDNIELKKIVFNVGSVFCAFWCCDLVLFYFERYDIRQVI